MEPARLSLAMQYERKTEPISCDHLGGFGLCVVHRFGLTHGHSIACVRGDL